MEIKKQIDEIYVELTGLRSRLQSIKSQVEGQWIDSVEYAIKRIKLAQSNLEDIK